MLRLYLSSKFGILDAPEFLSAHFCILAYYSRRARCLKPSSWPTTMTLTFIDDDLVDVYSNGGFAPALLVGCKQKQCEWSTITDRNVRLSD